MTSLERDVLECGVPLGDARALGKRYERAMHTGTGADWIELYIGVFVTLLRGAHRTQLAQAGAAQRMLQMLEDDLGAELFDEEALALIGLRLRRPESPQPDASALRDRVRYPFRAAINRQVLRRPGCRGVIR